MLRMHLPSFGSGIAEKYHVRVIGLYISGKQLQVPAFRDGQDLRFFPLATQKQVGWGF